MKLTPKQEVFITEYLIDMNSTQAAIRSGYSTNTAKEMGYQLLHKTSLKNIIDKKLEERALNNGLTAEFVLNGIKTIAVSGIKEGDKLRAYELLGKHLKLFVDKQETQITGETVSTSKIDFSHFTVEELKEMLKLK